MPSSAARKEKLKNTFVENLIVNKTPLRLFMLFISIRNANFIETSKQIPWCLTLYFKISFVSVGLQPSEKSIDKQQSKCSGLGVL